MPWKDSLENLRHLTQNSDVVIAIGTMVVLGVMVVPIPPLLLDMMLSLSIAISVGVLLTAVYAKKPLDFSTFPTVLLITTLFRLSLNVASTRNILLHGASDGTAAAGEIIKALVILLLVVTMRSGLSFSLF